MKIHRAPVALIFTLLIVHTAHAGPTCEKPKGGWKSAFGYAIEIESVDAKTKQLKGSYVLGEGKDATRSPLTGFWLTEGGQGVGADTRTVVQISFALPDFGSVTSWTGTCAVVSGTTALSIVTHGARVKSPYAWDHVIAASDYFVAQP